MRVLVACEFSGIVRDAFIRHGHNAVSCDFLPSESPGPHLQGNVLRLLEYRWDLVVAHPPCTFLCNSGVRWLHSDSTRMNKMREGASFFKEFFRANSPRVAIENPIMHKYAVEEIGHNTDFSIQPYQFGHPETKRICFHTLNLPSLDPTDIVEGRNPRVHRESPGPDRWKERSRFFPGVAEAMAVQWGKLPDMEIL